MGDSIKRQTLRGAIWTCIERVGNQGVGFAVSIVLARLLSPSDYGIIGMLSVFLNVSAVFVECGFSSALIRKKDHTDEDFSTVFWCNLAISIFFFALIFLAAPHVAKFYNMPTLCSILRVMGLTLVLNALYSVQVARLTALVDFKTQTKVTISACIVSGVAGIVLAYCGFGVWALVAQAVLLALYRSAAFWWLSGWHPKFVFRAKSFRELFSFGSRILASNLLHTVYQNISPLIIGKKYSTQDLGYYARGDSIAAMPGGAFQNTFGRVIFPILSSIQDDEMRLRSAYNKYLRLVTSIVAPTMLFIAVAAVPIITLIIGSKWLPCVPYLRILAIAWMVDPIILVNLNILYVKGRSDIVLKLEIIKKAIAISIVLVSVQYGVMWLCIGRLVYGFIALGLNLHYCGPFIGLGFWRQMREVAPVYCATALAALAAYPLASSMNGISAIAASAAVFFCVYSLFAWIAKFDLFVEAKQFLTKSKGSI